VKGSFRREEVEEMAERVFTTSDEVKIRRAASHLEPRSLLAEYFEKFTWYRYYSEHNNSSDNTAVSLLESLRSLSEDIKLKEDQQEIGIIMSLEKELTVIRLIIRDKVAHPKNNPSQIISEIRRLISDGTLEEMS
jgi:hypothetical protein